MTLKKKILLGVAGLLLAIQFVPVTRSNPPVTGDLTAPPEVATILRRSCYDCHSNETKWPWYGYVAPMSWAVTHDVEEARGYMNFSHWDQLSLKDQRYNLREALEEMEEGHMPLPAYLYLHRSARVSDDEIETVEAWVHSLYPRD